MSEEWSFEKDDFLTTTPYQQLQYTVKVQCTIRQQLEKFCRLFCGQCVNGLFLFLGCADLSHWILRYHFLLFGVAKYQIERSV